MNLVAVAGKVSHVNRIVSRLEGDRSNLEATYVTTLRVGGRQLKIGEDCSWVADNDHVAIVGTEIDDELLPWAIRNDTSGYVSIAEPSSSYGFAILMIVLGIALFALIIGIFMLGWGLWSLFKVNKDKQTIAEARRLLDSLPREAATPTP